jgi:hypothetical protein
VGRSPPILPAACMPSPDRFGALAPDFMS